MLFSLGVIFFYGLLQISVWGCLHAVFLFWAVVFPFSYRRFKISGRMPYAHVVCVVLAVVIPLPTMIHLKHNEGYTASFSPTLVCAGRNRMFTYYTFVLPSSITMCITSCLLLVIAWTIFKVMHMSILRLCVAIQQHSHMHM